MDILFQQNVLRLQVAVDHALALEKGQGAQHLLGKPTDQREREALELIGLDELVEVHAQKLGRNTEMAAEVEAVGKIDHAVLVFRILEHTVSS